MEEEKKVLNDKDVGLKYDYGKLRYDLVPTRPLEEVVKVYTWGATKYADHNWRRGISWSRIFGAIMRHCWAWFRGETYDQESGLHHMAHAAWNCMALIEFVTTHEELDDRFMIKKQSTDLRTRINYPFIMGPDTTKSNIEKTIILEEDGNNNPESNGSIRFYRNVHIPTIKNGIFHSIKKLFKKST